MDIRVLGNVEIHDGANVLTLRRAGERCVLATLALTPGHRVHIDTLIDHVWGESPPTNAGHTITSYVRAVRRTIERAGGDRTWLRNHRPGAYQLTITPALVDYHRFTALLAQARAHHQGGAPTDAITAYQQALQIRRGEALANITGQWADHRRYAIEQEHLEGLCAFYEQQLAIGQFAAVATSATHLITEVTPTDRMILLAAHGLAGSGQHAAIPEFMNRAAQRLRDTAQIELSPEVQAAAHDLITQPTVWTLATPTYTQPIPSDGDETTDPAPCAATSPHSTGPAGRAHNLTVVMTATHNATVYQAAGDQHITDA